MTAAKENPHACGEARGHDKDLEIRPREYAGRLDLASSLGRARSALRVMQESPGFDVDDFVSWNLRDFAEQYQISAGEALRLCRETTPKGKTGRFDKHDWLRQVAAMPHLSANELRLAVVIFGSINADLGFAWPSQQSLAEQAGGLHPRKVRAAVAGLEHKQLLKRGTISDLSESERDKLRRHGRGTYYIPTMPAQVVKTGRLEPEKLKRGKDAKRTAAVRSNRTTTVRSNRTAAVLLINEGKGRDQLDAGASSPHSQVSENNLDLEYEDTSTSAMMGARV